MAANCPLPETHRELFIAFWRQWDEDSAGQKLRPEKKSKWTSLERIQYFWMDQGVFGSSKVAWGPKDPTVTYKVTGKWRQEKQR